MCGRYGLFRPINEIAQLFDARFGPALAEAYRPSYNVAPTHPAVGLTVEGADDRVLDHYRWGFGKGLFNARSESAAASAIFGPALRHRRLVLVADGFYEWKGRREPLFFARADGAPLALAGLWERHAGVLACTMLTTSAGPDLDGIHDRMPVILSPDDLDRWFHDSRRATEMLQPASPGTLVHHAVEPRVGDVRNDDPELIAPYSPPRPPPDPEPLRLFG
jgi:putative SOS response-associated peptidase YedK